MEKAQWDSKDFIYPLDKYQLWANLSGFNSYSAPQARLYFWQQCQYDVLNALQEWIDHGWAGVGNVGPDNIIVETYRRWGVPWGILQIKPIAFRIRMRKQK